MTNVVVPPYQTNLLLTALALAAVCIQLVVVPLILLPLSPVIATGLVLLLSFGTSLNRALLHEAIHGRLVQHKYWNDRLGRVLSISFGTAFDAMRFGHLAHHRFPRHALDRADVIEPGRNQFAAHVKYYVELLGWIHVREIFGSAVMLLPRRTIEFLTDRALPNDDPIATLRGALRRGLDRRLARARADLLFAAVVYAGTLYIYGSWWPILLAGVALRALIISLQDNVAHYDTPAVVGAAAQNSTASRWVSFFILNENLHSVHHCRPELPWDELPSRFKSTGSSYAGSYLGLVAKQFHGPRLRI